MVGCFVAAFLQVYGCACGHVISADSGHGHGFLPVPASGHGCGYEFLLAGMDI
jgi:hypothetical protein